MYLQWRLNDDFILKYIYLKLFFQGIQPAFGVILSKVIAVSCFLRSRKVRNLY